MYYSELLIYIRLTLIVAGCTIAVPIFLLILLPSVYTIVWPVFIESLANYNASFLDLAIIVVGGVYSSEILNGRSLSILVILPYLASKFLVYLSRGLIFLSFLGLLFNFHYSDLSLMMLLYDGLVASRRTVLFDSLLRRCLTRSIYTSISSAGTEVALNTPIISLTTRV